MTHRRLFTTLSVLALVVVLGMLARDAVAVENTAAECAAFYIPNNFVPTDNGGWKPNAKSRQETVRLPVGYTPVGGGTNNGVGGLVIACR